MASSHLGRDVLTFAKKFVPMQSKTLVVGGLDVLETIGKKTYDALAEGDHGLKNTIRNTGAKPNLSQVCHVGLLLSEISLGGIVPSDLHRT